MRTHDPAASTSLDSPRREIRAKVRPRRPRLRILAFAAGLIISVFTLNSAGAQVHLERTQTHTLHSPVNDVDYQLWISVPEGFEESREQYPVVFFLDPEYSFAIARNIVEHLVQRRDLPPLVLVGVGYPDGDSREGYRLNRSRDYTPVHHDEDGYGPRYSHVTGNAPAFLEALAEHIVPWVEAEFRGSGERMLVGHSFGGLFALWTELYRPGLFDRLIAVSPSVWYADYELMTQLNRFVDSGARSRSRVFAMVGALEVNARRSMVEDLRRYGEVHRAVLGENGALVVRVGDGETHNSIFPRALSDGLRWHWPREEVRAGLRRED